MTVARRADAPAAAVTDAIAPAAPRVSVIIPHLNQLESLVRCLQSIDAQDYPADQVDVIVVDNGSRVDLAPLARTRPEVVFLSEPTPGPGPARNRGVARATGEILLFIDADCRAEPTWIASAVRALLETPERGLVGGDVRIDFARPPRLTGLEAYEAVFAYRQQLYIQRDRYSGTGNLGMWAPVHQAVGPFRGISFAEDMDWGQRADALGYRVRYVPDMVIHHPARTDFDGLTAKWRRHVSHGYAAHAAAGRPWWRWRALALAMIASVAVDAWRLLLSPRLAGIGNRTRGLAILWRIRAFRCREMLRVVNSGHGGGSSEWNRTA